MIVAIVQARMGSTRLPGKCVLRLPSGKTVIEQVIDRAKAIPGVGAVAVAMPMEDYGTGLHIACGAGTDEICFGHATDLMQRYWDCCRMLFDHGSPPTSIIRVTADDPFRDPGMEAHVGRFIPKYDYVRTIDYPEGINAEAFSIDALAYAVKYAAEREHLTTHFVLNTTHQLLVRAPQDYAHLRCTLDTSEDWEVIQAIDRAGCKTTGEIIRFWEARNAENRPR